MVYKFFDKKTKGSGRPSSFASWVTNNKENIQLADELHKPIVRKFKKRKVYSSFRDNIWGADLADMQLLSKLNKGFRFLLCFIDIYSKYAWVIPLKHKKGVSIVNAFQKIFKESNRKPNKIWVDKGGKFYNNFLKKWLQDNDITMYERFMRALKTKIYKFINTWPQYQKMCTSIK